MIAIARDFQPIDWQPRRRVSVRRCPPATRSLQILLAAWLTVASLGYIAALLG